MIWQSGEHVGEPGTRIDVVELGGLDQRVDGCGAPAAVVRSCKSPIAAADGNTTQRPLGGLLDTHNRPSSRKRVRLLQQLRLWAMALAT
jgi:hypothetical protein